MKSGWTPARKARQAALIRNWRPWERSTGPKSLAGKAVSANNAFKGGFGAELRALRKEVNAKIKAVSTMVRGRANE